MVRRSSRSPKNYVALDDITILARLYARLSGRKRYVPGRKPVRRHIPKNVISLPVLRFMRDLNDNPLPPAAEAA